MSGSNSGDQPAKADQTPTGSGTEKAATSPPHKIEKPTGEVRPVTLAVAVIIGLILWFVPVPRGVAPNAWHLMAIFVATIVGIIGKAAPMGTLSMLAIGLCAFTRVLVPGSTSKSIHAALSGFSNGVIWLIVLAFFIARGVIKTGLGTRLAYWFIRLFGKNTLGLVYGLGAADLVLAPAIPSNTARAGGVIYPIMKSIAESFGSRSDEPSTHRRIGTYMALVGYNVNLVTSVIFLTGTASNPMAQKFAADATKVHLSWMGWLTAAIVPGLLCFLLVPVILYFTCPPELKKTPDASAKAAAELNKLGSVTFKEWLMVGVFILLLVMWVMGDAYLNATTAALLGLSVLLLSGVLTWDDVKGERAAWDTLVWFSALVMMGTYLHTLGFIDWFGGLVKGQMVGLTPALAFIVLVLVYAFSHYMFASGTAHTAAMFSVFLAVGLGFGLPVVPLTVILGSAASLMGCLTHYGHGPAPIYFGSNYVEIGTWWKQGLIIGIMFMVVWIGVGSAWWHVIGIW